MSSKARRERERHALREAMLQAALAIAAEEGWQALTMRKLAERIEYSPGMIYEYFANKEALLVALLEDGYRQMVDALEQASHDVAPQDKLVAMARAYWQFAGDNPALYQVMHGLNGAPFNHTEGPENERLVALMGSALGELAGPYTLDELYDMLDIAWSTLHGLIALNQAEHIIGGPARGLALAEQAIGILARDWQQRHPH